MAKKRPQKTAAPARQKRPKDPLEGLAFEVTGVRITESRTSIFISDGVIPKDSHTVAHPKIGVAESENILLGSIEIEALSGKSGETIDKSKSHFSIACTLQCVFQAGDVIQKGKITPEIAVALMNVTMNVGWPYIRLFVQTMSASMGMPPITLPLFRPQIHAQTVKQITLNPD